MNEIKYACRQFLKSPGFSSVVILTLALGIGANTAIFSVIHAVLLKPLPYPDAQRLVTLWERNPEQGIDQERVSGPTYLDWRAQNSIFTDLAVCPGWVGSDTFNLVQQDVITKVHATYASASLFSTLAVKPLLGRTLLAEEDQREGNRAAVLSYPLWQQRFGGNSNVLGQKLTLDTYGRRDYTIVGIMPSGFGAPSACELWLPLGWMGVRLDERRSAHWHNVLARLKPGVSVAQARLELNRIQHNLKQEHPGDSVGSEVAVVPMLDQALGPNLRRALLVLWGAVAGVLLIACANVANLMLARAALREKEIALRLALGSGRWRVLRQLLVESMILGLAGGVVGVLLGWWILRMFIALSPADIPRLNSATLDPIVLGFTLVISVLTGLLFGSAPAWQFSRPNVNETLKDNARGHSSGVGAGLTRSWLITAEVALSIVLLAGAALMLQSFARILSVDRGFVPEHLLTADLDFSVSGFTTWVRPTATRPQVPLHELIERIRALPGVQAVGAASRTLRKENAPPAEAITIFGQPASSPEAMSKAEFKGVSPDWVRAMGARVRLGRDLTEADVLTSPGAVLINETMAKRYFPNGDPIGHRLRMGVSQPALNATNVYGLPEWSTVVGVVTDTKSLALEPQVIPEVYQSYWQWPMQSPTLFVRVKGEPLALAGLIRRELKEVIPNLPAPEIHTMESVLSEAVAQPRLQTGLISVFAGLALLLTAVGLYGVLAYTVTQRTREIGVRMALGAQKRNVLILVMRHGMKLVLIGSIIGVILAVVITRVLHGLLYNIAPTDPVTFGAVCLLMGLIAFVACLFPACRAARLEPSAALKYE